MTKTAMKVHHLFGEESALAERMSQLQITAIQHQLEAIRKEIVATKEGGAITGEQRLREFTDELYATLVLI